jgi:hypothetical protein
MLVRMRSRASFFGSLTATVLLATLCFSQDASGPWLKSEVLQPADFAASLKSSSAKPPTILCVAFPVLYRSRHIVHAVLAGPTSKPEGIDLLKKAVAGLPKDSDIVIYCGCCPMEKCPNVRPAYQALKEMGYNHLRVLNIPTNMRADWYSKDYPSEAGNAAD